MRKLLAAPVKMALTDVENTIYQNVLKHATELSLNLMAVKVEHRPEDFLAWCRELHRLCREGLNYDLLEPEQLAPLKKLQEQLEKGISYCQLKMLRIAPWPIFVQYIEQNADILALDERLRLLAFLAPLRAQPLTELNDLDLAAFAGRHTSEHDAGVYDFDVEWFASTKGAKRFQQLLADDRQDFQHALDCIPLEGEVSQADYQSFVKAYTAIFERSAKQQGTSEKVAWVPATRLLAMRRPDQFVALNNAKLDVIAQGLGIAKICDFSSYWDELILTLRSLAWWRQTEPEADSERQLWQYRAILLDVFLFADDTSPLKSNYLKLKERAQNRPIRSATNTTARKRTKETAEAIVDRKLAEPDMPAYLLEKRDSLVHEVKNGKSVDQAIRLFRAIFG